MVFAEGERIKFVAKRHRNYFSIIYSLFTIQHFLQAFKHKLQFTWQKLANIMEQNTGKR